MNKTYTVRPGDSLASIAQKFQLSLEELRNFNKLSNDLLRVGQILVVSPIALTNTPQTKKHIVRLGESLYVIAKQYDLSVSELKQLNRLVSSNLRVGQELIVSEPLNTHSTEEPLKEEESSDSNYSSYVVIEGESLHDIAQKFSMTVAEISQINELSSNHLNVGQKLKLPAHLQEKTKESPDFHIVSSGDSLYAIARKYGLSINEIRRLNSLNSDAVKQGQKIRIKEEVKENASDSAVNLDAEFHEVQSGESLYAIARMYQLSIPQIKGLNNLSSDVIKVGQSLRVKGSNLAPTPSESNTNLSNVNNQDFPFEIKSYIEARKIFKLKAKNGVDIFEGGLKGAVGRNHINRAEDLVKVQTRLVALNFLSSNHKESPEEIQAKIGGAAITANYIPQTIAAIEKFQKEFQVRFWTEHSVRVAMMQSNQYTPGVIFPNDVTYKILREYTEYSLEFPNPHTSQEHTVNFHTFPIHSQVRFYQGVSFTGDSNPEIPANVFKRLGLNENLATALKYVTKHEANFDAIHSYKESIFSYGFVQFGANGGTLAPMLANIKQKAPKIFKAFFQDFGLDVTYQMQDENIKNAEIIIANPYDKGGKYLVKGVEAERIIRADKQLYGIFIRAGHYLPIVTLQIDSAIKHYVQPALVIHLHVIAGSLNLTNLLVTDIIRSPMGTALLISIVIHRWIHITREIIRDAIEKLAIKHSLYSKEELLQIDERELISRIIADANSQGDTLLVEKATNILHSGLSWKKT